MTALVSYPPDNTAMPGHRRAARPVLSGNSSRSPGPELRKRAVSGPAAMPRPLPPYPEIPGAPRLPYSPPGPRPCDDQCCRLQAVYSRSTTVGAIGRAGPKACRQFPTGWMAADNCEIEPADIVAICGPVGQFCIKSALMLGAARVIAIDNVPERLALARLSGAETVDFDGVEETVLETLKELTGGHGPARASMLSERNPTPPPPSMPSSTRRRQRCC